MLSEDKIIALYCIVDDLLKAMQHHEDKIVRVSDSEVITTAFAFVSVLYFGGHLENGRHFMKLKGYVAHMLSKSRFCRSLTGSVTLCSPCSFTWERSSRTWLVQPPTGWTPFRFRYAITSAFPAARC